MEHLDWFYGQVTYLQKIKGVVARCASFIGTTDNNLKIHALYCLALKMVEQDEFEYMLWRLSSL